MNKDVESFVIILIVEMVGMNKMGASNFSAVMRPCLFRPKKYTVSDLVNSPRLVNLLFDLIGYKKIE